MTCLYFLEVTHRAQLSGTCECAKTIRIYLTGRGRELRWILAFFNHYTERKIICLATDRLNLWLFYNSISYHSYPSVFGKHLMKLVLQKQNKFQEQNKFQKHGLEQKSNIIPYQRDVYVMFTLRSEGLHDDSTPTAAVWDLRKLSHVEASSF